MNCLMSNFYKLFFLYLSFYQLERVTGNSDLIRSILNGFLNFIFRKNFSRLAIQEVVQSSNSFIAEEVYVDKGHINTKGSKFQTFQGIKQANSLEKMKENKILEVLPVVNFLTLELKMSNLMRKGSL